MAAEQRDLEREADQHEKALHDQFGLLGNDIERAKLRDGEFWVVAHTALQPMLFHEGGNKANDAFLPPNSEFRQQYLSEAAVTPTTLRRVAKRIRNYATYACDYPIPIFYFLIGKRIRFSQSLGTDQLSPLPANLVIDSIARKVWTSNLSTKYEIARRLLTKVKADSFLDRAINLYGEALWSADDEDKYLNAWRAIENIADQDFLKAQANYENELASTVAPYLEENVYRKVKLKGGQVSKERRVIVTVKNRLSVIDEKKIGGLADLRHAIAHGEVTQEKFDAITREVGNVTKLSRDTIASAIAAADL